MRKAEITLEYQNYIERPPVSESNLYAQSCSNDAVTINSWRDTWISQFKANHAKHGPFKERSIGELFGKNKYRPAIIAGSGPSLKVNAEELKNRGEILLISCLHNFHFFEDQGIAPDYYVTLDAGPVTIEEVSEGGTKTPEEYWALTKDRTLLAFISTHPDLLAKWQWKILFFNAPVPDQEFQNTVEQLERFNTYVSTGGNVLGASLYIARAIMQSATIAFVGADFAFSYNTGAGHKFHAWGSKYDKNIGYVLKAIDVYGNSVKTWQSYANFKAWFECVAMKCPGIWINCTEGGTLGAYPEGNIMAIRQMELKAFIEMYEMGELIKESCSNPSIEQRVIAF
jgi:hypothetical protein